jgi:hypothetical protein
MLDLLASRLFLVLAIFRNSYKPEPDNHSFIIYTLAIGASPNIQLTRNASNHYRKGIVF